MVFAIGFLLFLYLKSDKNINMMILDKCKLYIHNRNVIFGKAIYTGIHNYVIIM